MVVLRVQNTKKSKVLGNLPHIPTMLAGATVTHCMKHMVVQLFDIMVREGFPKF